MLLTDIVGDEDHFGDMDFKIAGTHKGITGIQLDLKINGISEKIIEAAMTQAKKARLDILKAMLESIPKPRKEVSEHAPQLTRVKINPEKIGALIGPGGKNIRAVQDETGTVIEVDDEGNVTIAAGDRESADAAKAMVDGFTANVEIGRIYDGTVSSVKDFGAFVEIIPGRDGLCHISELSTEYIGNISDVVKQGDEMKVLVISVDEHDRVKLSRRQALEQLGEEDDMGGK